MVTAEQVAQASRLRTSGKRLACRHGSRQPGRLEDFRNRDACATVKNFSVNGSNHAAIFLFADPRGNAGGVRFAPEELEAKRWSIIRVKKLRDKTASPCSPTCYR